MDFNLKKALTLASIILLISFIAYKNYHELAYKLDWYLSAKKPIWWNELEVPKMPPDKDPISYIDKVLTEPCCQTEKYKLELKIKSKVAYQTVMNSYEKPTKAALAIFGMSYHQVTGWNRERILQFYMRHFYWVDFTRCVNCMVADLTWNRIEELVHVNDLNGEIRTSLEIIEQFLRDRGHELHPRNHFEAQDQIAQIKYQLGMQQEALNGIHIFLSDFKDHIHGNDYYYKKLQKTCNEIKLNACSNHNIETLDEPNTNPS